MWAKPCLYTSSTGKSFAQAIDIFWSGSVLYPPEFFGSDTGRGRGADTVKPISGAYRLQAALDPLFPKALLSSLKTCFQEQETDLYSVDNPGQPRGEAWPEP